MLSSSESAVLVSVFVNPTAATLRPTDRVFEVGVREREGVLRKTGAIERQGGGRGYLVQ